MDPKAQRLKAIFFLVTVTAFWSVSFPVMKAITLAQQKLIPGVDSWFISASCVSLRFGWAALIMLLWCLPTLRQLTRLEISQGLGLGLFGSAGLVIQMDGLAYTSASTSAFLTQCYALIIPIWIAITQKRWPSGVVVIACIMVMAGVGVLADVDWRSFRMGRGEVETLLSSIMFAGQILWLQRSKFASNNANHFSLVMFAVMSLSCLPVGIATSQAPGDWVRGYCTWTMLAFLAVLVFFCTLGGYLIMNHWQRHVSATEAGLIYCVEPVLASAVSLFMPAWLSVMAGIEYANETVTSSLLVGGGLVTLANVLIQVRPSAPSVSAPPEAASSSPSIS